MRSAVQSCVPLQESTAKRCAFFVYCHQAFARRGWTLSFLALKACFQSGRNDNGHKWAQRTKAWWRLWWKSHRNSNKSFLGYNATGQKGLEGAVGPAVATETSCVPPLENQALTKVSWVLFSLWGTLGELENSEFRLIFIISIDKK